MHREHGGMFHLTFETAPIPGPDPSKETLIWEG